MYQMDLFENNSSYNSETISFLPKEIRDKLNYNVIINYHVNDLGNVYIDDIKLYNANHDVCEEYEKVNCPYYFNVCGLNIGDVVSKSNFNKILNVLKEKDVKLENGDVKEMKSVKI